MNQNPFFTVLLILFAAFASSGLLIWLLPFLRIRMLDQPNARSSHLHPTPRGGGVVFVLLSAASGAIGCFAALADHPSSLSSQLAMLALPALSLPLAAVGFLDDRYNLSSELRYCVQLATAFSLLLACPLSLPVLLLPLLLVSITAVINFTNFMDGVDGLVAGCMAVSIAALAVVLDAPWPLWALVGSLLGFLLWNWSPAKVFMGDVGSTFLGAVFAGLVLQASCWLDAFGYLLVASPLLADAFLCVSRRLLAGQRVFQAHRLHLFQRLHQAGWSHARVSLTYISATTVLAVAMLAGGWPWVFALSVLVLLLGIWLDQRIAVPFSVSSRS